MAIADDVWRYARTMWQNEDAKFNGIAYTFLCSAIASAIALQFVNAPYGRYSRDGWGFRVPSRIAWFLQELPSFLMPLLLLAFSDCPLSRQWKNQVALGLFLLHYFQRTFIFSLLIKGGKPTPLVTFLMAFAFCMVNGYLQGGHLLKCADLNSVSDIRFYSGALMFLAGMFINIHSDHILRNLRKDGEKGYKIPRGGLFEYVSGANFFGECLEWAGLATMCGTFPTFVFAFFTVCNIGPRACQHHRWYLEKFEDYPKDRKALIPFIW